jgi:co-chaperonin GroES (HSP10)
MTEEAQKTNGTTAAVEAATKDQVVGFQPFNDFVLLKLDSKRRSSLEIRREKPKVLPSGVVLAVGRGTFVHGTGFVGSQVEVGDHVAVIPDPTSWFKLPLSEDEGETFIVVSESQVMGKLDGADHASPWFKTKNDDVDLSIVG